MLWKGEKALRWEAQIWKWQSKKDKIRFASQWKFSYPKLFEKPCMHKALHLGQWAKFPYSPPPPRWQNTRSWSEATMTAKFPLWTNQQGVQVFLKLRLSHKLWSHEMFSQQSNAQFDCVLINLLQGAHAFKDSVFYPSLLFLCNLSTC